MNIYTLIIGSEILNGRRADKHFSFMRDELTQYGCEIFASFILKDDKKLIEKAFEFVKSDKDSILFSFGGIGSTPDDLTREIAAKVFTKKPLKRNKQFEKDIIEKFGDEAYPHRIHMADLPEGAELIFNPVNNMSGFSLENRFFFTPGFPVMAHPMVKEILKTLCSKKTKPHRVTLLANTSENTLITQMNLIPPHIELSSLPIFKDSKAHVELSLSGFDKSELIKYFEIFIDELEKKDISYTITQRIS